MEGDLLQMDGFWKLIGLLMSIGIALFTALFAAARLLLNQILKRIDEKFAAVGAQNSLAQEHWTRHLDSTKEHLLSRIQSLEKDVNDNTDMLKRVEREISDHRLHVADRYAERDDMLEQMGRLTIRLDNLARRACPRTEHAPQPTA